MIHEQMPVRNLVEFLEKNLGEVLGEILDKILKILDEIIKILRKIPKMLGEMLKVLGHILGEILEEILEIVKEILADGCFVISSGLRAQFLSFLYEYDAGSWSSCRIWSCSVLFWYPDVLGR
jgi:2-hydroxy-3-keto-5-methylthiopentenyl-1-phosphate phosphatase